jgi:hypothetical protein
MRTILRNKLSQTLSHPIGLGLLESALAGVPQLESLRVVFSDGPWQATKFRRSLRDREPYALLTVSYRPAHKPGFIGSEDMVESGLYDEAWELTVNPTLRELRALARRLLLSDGLPAVASWLRRAHAEAGDSRYRGSELTFDPDNESLELRERVGA